MHFTGSVRQALAECHVPAAAPHAAVVAKLGGRSALEASLEFTRAAAERSRVRPPGETAAAHGAGGKLRPTGIPPPSKGMRHASARPAQPLQPRAARFENVPLNAQSAPSGEGW